MALSDFIDKLPEESREAYKAEIAKAVIINSREDVAALRKSNPAFEAEFVNELRTKNESFAAEYVRDKLPKLVDEEVRKRNPPKDEKDLRWEQERDARIALERRLAMRDSKEIAVKKLSEIGIPIDFADFVVHESPEIMTENINKFTSLVAWKEAEVKKALTGAVGNQKSPVGGKPGAVSFDKMTTTEMMNYAAQGPVEKQAVLDWQKMKR